jgi:hypothetical protein
VNQSTAITPTATSTVLASSSVVTGNKHYFHFLVPLIIARSGLDSSYLCQTHSFAIFSLLTKTVS